MTDQQFNVRQEYTIQLQLAHLCTTITNQNNIDVQCYMYVYICCMYAYMPYKYACISYKYACICMIHNIIYYMYYMFLCIYVSIYLCTYVSTAVYIYVSMHAYMFYICCMFTSIWYCEIVVHMRQNQKLYHACLMLNGCPTISLIWLLSTTPSESYLCKSTISLLSYAGRCLFPFRWNCVLFRLMHSQHYWHREDDFNIKD